MKKITVGIIAGWFAILILASETASSQELSVDEIVAKNIAARGGIDAWRNIQTMIWIGHIESPNAPEPKLPFVLEMKRPGMSRFQIEVQNQTSVNVFDGTQGWKVRSSRDGQPQMQAFTAEDVRFAQEGPGIDGQLIDYKSKGSTVTFDGDDNVEGRKAYRLRVTLSSGVTHHVWIDANSFLDIKYDREVRNAFGQSGMVSVYYRNYRAVDGLQIPFEIETTADAAKASDKMVFDRILLNSPLDDRIFARPPLPMMHRSMATVDTRPQGGKQPWPVLSSHQATTHGTPTSSVEGR